MAKIVVVGSINMDFVVRTSRIPIPGETVLGSDFRTFAGGKGANQAVAAARQEAEVLVIGRVGADSFGQQLREGLENEGIDHRFVSVDPSSPTGIALITLDQNGQNSIVVAPGANHTLAPHHILEAQAAFERADILLLQLEVPLETSLAAAQQAKAHRVKVVLNPAPAQPLPSELLSFVDVLIPNESEIALLTGMPVSTLSQLESAAQTLLSQGVGKVIVTVGDRGALLLEKMQGLVHIPSFPADVVDTTAAGDSFIGAFAVALGNGAPIKDAIRSGCAAGSLAVSHLGAQASIPTKQEVDSIRNSA